MSERDYYPAGAYEDPRAPWNQSEPDGKEFDVCISQTLSKSTSVNTNDYYIESNFLDADEGGGYVDEVITKETDWNKAYNEEHMTPLELIQEFEECLKDLISTNSYGHTMSKSKCEILLRECSDWTEDETEIVEE